jgi:uncharacterized membrane protein
LNLTILILVLSSAFLHPIWNLLIKKNCDPDLGFFCLTATLSLVGLAHGLIAGDDFSLILTVLPFIALSVAGQLIYGNALTATLKRGDLSVYYPIIRASPIFIVLVSVLFLGKAYALVILLGIGMTVVGGFLLLYRRGSNFFKDGGTLCIALLAMSGTGIYSLADASLMKTITPAVSIFIVDGVITPFYLIKWLRRRRKNRSPSFDLNYKSIASLLIPGLICYLSYYLILLAYQYDGDVAIVTSIRQASIPFSVLLGGFFLREGAIFRRFIAAGILTLGIVVIITNS